MTQLFVWPITNGSNRRAVYIQLPSGHVGAPAAKFEYLKPFGSFKRIIQKETVEMPVRNAEATWKGTLREGAGSMKLGSGAFEGAFTYASRFEEGKGTNPEELIGAAHAGCFSMFLSALLSNAGYTPTNIHTTAKVHLGEGPAIKTIELSTEALVPNLNDTEFQRLADTAKSGCPVSKALAGVDIQLTAKLAS
jgi:osmotically inducible protein OsmC